MPSLVLWPVPRLLAPTTMIPSLPKAALHDAVKPPPKEGEEEAKSVGIFCHSIFQCIASSTKTVKVYWNASRNPFAQRIRQLKK